jgi:hypothetical protein
VSGWLAGLGQLLTLAMHYQGDRFRLQTLNV